MKLKAGDEIIVTAGKDKSRRGKISRVFPKKSLVLIPGLNVYKKHQKSTPAGAGGQKGGIFEFSRPLAAAKVALLCPNCKKQTRVGYKALKDGTQVRICKKCGKQINEAIGTRSSSA